ncbi:MAG: hypothetical protein JSR65_05035, partial [Proteobacteria bacterium]|nr:hypothetical protein [Pseudomonadota bacterium]
TFGISTNGNGVAGYSTTGTGVFGHSNSGFGMATDGHAKQVPGTFGWVKAMITYSQRDGMKACFNSQASGAQVTTPPCGFTIANPESGHIQVNVGFNIDHSFIMVTPFHDGYNGHGTMATNGICTSSCDITGGNVVVIGAFDASGNPSSNTDVTIFVF